MIIPILLAAMLAQQAPAVRPIIVNLYVSTKSEAHRALLGSCVANKLRAMQGIEVVMNSPEGSDLEVQVLGIAPDPTEVGIAALYIGIPLMNLAAFSGAEKKPNASMMIYFGMVAGQTDTTSSTCERIAAAIDNKGINTIRVVRLKP